MKYRIRYQKNDELIFISHLDLQRLFQRAFRRANVELSYSEGFHPHPKMSYSPPLPLFISSAEEYLDVELRNDIDPELFQNTLQDVLPQSLVIDQITSVDPQERKITKSIDQAEYVIQIESEENDRDLCNKIEHAFRSDIPLVIRKKNKKKKLVTKDLRSGILSLTCAITDHGCCIHCILSLNEEDMINPFHIIKAFQKADILPEEINISSVRKIRMIKKTEH